MSQLSNKARIFACSAVLSTLAGVSLSAPAIKAESSVEPLVATESTTQIVAVAQPSAVVERSVEADVQGASIAAPAQGSLAFWFSWLSDLFDFLSI